MIIEYNILSVMQSSIVHGIPQCVVDTSGNFLDIASNLAEIIASLIGGFCALKGIGYLESLREKKANATFSFEAQLYAHLFELKIILAQNEKLLTGLYSEDARKEWRDTSAAPDRDLNRFYVCAKNTLDFIKTTPDQMPVYENWTIDYRKLILFLVDVIHYDIRDTKNNFKFYGMCDIEDRRKYWDSACALLQAILDGISRDQNEIENKLFNKTEQ